MQTDRRLFVSLRIIRAWLGRWLGAGASPADRFVRWLTLGCVALGIGLRCRGVLFGSTLPLWSDESIWVIFLRTQPLTELFIRPVGFMAITRVLVDWFEPKELVVRSLPWLGGIATVLLAPVLARRTVHTNAARLLVVAVIALHPAAIDLARDFKPYALGLLFHVGLLIAAYDYAVRGRSLALALGLSLVAVLFAQDAIFVYPGLFLTLLIAAWRRSEPRHLLAIAGTALATLTLVAGLYVAIWKNLDRDGERDYWGERYDVFHLEQSGRSKPAWFGGKLAEIAAMPGMRRTHWQDEAGLDPELPLHARIDFWLWAALGALGSVQLVRRRRAHELLLLLGPIAMLTVFNWLGRWPYGAFRTNLFLLAYVTPLAALAFDFRSRVWQRAGPVPALGLVLLPFAVFNQHFHGSKHTFSATSYFPDVLEHLLRGQDEDPRGRELLLLDTKSCYQWKYYVRYHPRFRERQRELERERFRVKCGKSTRKLLQEAGSGVKRNKRVWGIATGDWQRDELTQPFRVKRMRRLNEERFNGEHVVVALERR